VVQANQTGRLLALVLLAFFGLALLISAQADRLSQPLVRLAEPGQSDPIPLRSSISILGWPPTPSPLVKFSGTI